MRLQIGVPNYGETKIEMMMSLIPNLFYLDRIWGVPRTIDYNLSCPAGCHNYQNRNKIVQDALDFKADYLFMVDTDMVFPDDALYKLMRADKDIIGGTYNKRSMPITPIHRAPREVMPQHVFKVNAVPTGLILIKAKVLQTMEPPWFAVQWLEGVKFMGPDIYFCEKATRTYGFEVWLDPTIDIKHIGEYKY